MANFEAPSSFFERSPCPFPHQALLILWCIIEENFKNCPPTMIVDSSKFEEVKKYVETEVECGLKLESFFTIDPRFWYALNDADASTTPATKTEE